MIDQSVLLEHVRLHLAKTDPAMVPYAEVIAAHANLRKLKAGEILPSIAEGQRQLVGIIDGVLRLFYLDENQKEVTVQLLMRGDLLIRTDAYQNVAPNRIYQCQSLTRSRMIVWSHESLEYFMQNVPNWHHFAMKKSQELLLKAAAERSEMFKDDATMRYLKFVEQHPTIVDLIQLRHVADYLGIAPQSLSRIRQQVSQHGKIN
jgi:CRP-like cAMP-binding protein